MAERVIPMRSTERTNEIVRHLWLKSSTARARSNTAYHRVRVGIAQGSAVEWLGAWEQLQSAIGANEKYLLSGEYPLNIPLIEGDELVVGITTTGSPASLDGMSVEIKGARAGGVGVQNVVRKDGAFPPGAEVADPLISVGANIADPATKDAIVAITDLLNESGIADWSHSHALTDIA